MVRGGITKGMVVVVFILSAVGECAPTLVDCNCSAVAGSVVRKRGESFDFCVGTVGIAGRENSPLAAVAAEFNKPPVRYQGASTPVSTTKTLPAVPGALLMVVAGFICVSLVRDRRTWFAIATCLLWAGQSGFSFLPRVALCVAGNRQWGERFSDRFSSPPRRRCLICDKLDSSGARVSLPQVKQRFGPVQSADARRVLFEIYTANSLARIAEPAARHVSTLIRTNLARGPPNSGQIAHIL